MKQYQPSKFRNFQTASREFKIFDYTAQNLRHWADRYETLNLVFFILFLLVSIGSSVYICFTPIYWPFKLIMPIFTIISSIIIFFTYKITTSILNTLADTAQNTRTTANYAEYSAYLQWEANQLQKVALGINTDEEVTEETPLL